jgi:hypothetical protein
VKTKHIQAGNKKKEQGLLVYSVRERGEKRYANNIEKSTVRSVKRQGRGGIREDGLCTGGLQYRQPSDGQYISQSSCGEASDGNNIYKLNVSRKASDGIHSQVTLQ